MTDQQMLLFLILNPFNDHPFDCLPRSQEVDSPNHRLGDTLTDDNGLEMNLVRDNEEHIDSNMSQNTP